MQCSQNTSCNKLDVKWPNSTSFIDSIHQALTDGVNLVIKPSTIVHLSESVILKYNKNEFMIYSDATNESDYPIIISEGHSLFQIEGRKTSLKLQNIKLQHTFYHSNKANIGAVIFVLNSSKVQLNHCYIDSHHGFGIWGVQNAIINIQHCHITSRNRSGIVAFGKTKISAYYSHIYDCYIHNLCTRGNTVIELQSCQLTGAKKRSIYAYHSVNMTIDNCIISDTQSSDSAAIEIYCALPVPSSFKQHTTHNNSNNINSNYHKSDEIVDISSNLSLENSLICDTSNNTSKGHGYDNTIFKTSSDPLSPPCTNNSTKVTSTCTSTISHTNITKHRYKNGQGIKKHIPTFIQFIMKNTIICNNQGIGLLLRDSSEWQIQSNIDNCTFENNMKGDIIHKTENKSYDDIDERNHDEIFTRNECQISDDNAMKIQNFQGNHNDVQLSQQLSRLSLENTVITSTCHQDVCVKTSQVNDINAVDSANDTLKILWEYEVDDASLLQSSNQHTINNSDGLNTTLQMTGWRPYDKNICMILEHGYQQYLYHNNNIYTHVNTDNLFSNNMNDIDDINLDPSKVKNMNDIIYDNKCNDINKLSIIPDINFDHVETDIYKYESITISIMNSNQQYQDYEIKYADMIQINKSTYYIRNIRRRL